MATVGEVIEKRVEEYKELYRMIENNPVPGATAREIIEGEIALRKFEWDQISLEMWRYFEKEECDGNR